MFRKQVTGYFQAKMPQRIKMDIYILTANLWGHGGDFSQKRIDRVREWIYSKSVYTDGDELYNRYAKNRWRIDASDYKTELLKSLAGYI